MHTDPRHEAEIVASWKKNALPWTAAVREGRIESRQRVTDRAIVDAILDCSPRSVLDVGCGEGWLVRKLARHGIEAKGVDAIDQLIEAAQEAGGGDFRVLSYEQIAAGEPVASTDAIVCNFSLLGRESVEGIFQAAPSLLNPHGSLIVQTLHPLEACGELPYQDEWREGSWAGFSSDFSNPAPWYFRTMESWTRMFAANGFRLIEMREPIHPQSQRPASVIFVGKHQAP